SDGSATAQDTFVLNVVDANGAPCSSGVSCLSGFCVDGVCCNNACAGGTTDCQACSVAAGGSTNGTCGTVSAATVCRSAAGSCDVAEMCPGPLYSKTLTFDGTQVPGALTNFAVLVRLTDANLQARAATNGSDIYFTATSGGSVLDYEIESY